MPAINSRQVELLDDAKLIAQLCSLERRTARGGRDSIDHAPAAHDDLVNAVAGVIALLATPAYDNNYSNWVFEPRTTTNGEPPFCEQKSPWQHPYFNGGYRR